MNIEPHRGGLRCLSRVGDNHRLGTLLLSPPSDHESFSEVAREDRAV
jgi:hypothetical protein